jgi:ABC-type antimicrobial peptide transport system permease subunit
MGESALVAVLGSLIGTALGFAVVMIVSAGAHWHPVFDTRLVLVGVVGAGAFGVVGGLVPAVSAARVEPADAVRA